MADKGVITREQIFQQEAIDSPKEYANNLKGAIDATNKLIQSATALNNLSKEFKGVKTSKQFLEVQSKSATETEQVAIALKEQNRYEKALITSIERKKIVTESTNRQLIKERTDVNLLNKEIREQAILTSGLSGAYKKLNLQRTQAKRKLLDLIASEKSSSVEIKKAQQNYDLLDRKVRKADNAVGDFTKNVGNYKSGFSGLTKVVRGLVGAFGVIEGLKLAFNFAKESRQLAIEAKGVEFALIGIEKRTGDAENALLRVKKSTRGLMSELDIKKAIVELDNFNIGTEETATLMEFLAVRASQTGQSIDKLKDSLVEGLSKESKLRIDNLGISASELNAELEKTPDFTKAVANIARKEIKEAGSILDDAGNSQEKWNADLQNFQLRVGNGFVSRFSDGLFDIGSNLLRILTPAKDLTTQFEEQAQKVINLEKNLSPLVDEYDTLRLKSELSNKEQSRLKVVISDISKIVPTAISQFDEYGNALDINSDKAKEFITNQKALLAFRNKEALEEEKEALEDYQKEIKSLNKILNNRDAEGNIVQSVVKGGKVSRIEQKKLSAEVIQEKQAELAKLQQLEIGAKQSIEQLSGDYLDKIIQKEKEQTKKQLEELQARAKDLKIDIEGKTASELKYLISKKENYKSTNTDIIKNDEKLKETLLKSQLELSKQQIQSEIDKQNSILNNEKSSFDERFKANVTLKTKLLALAKLERDEEVRILDEKLKNKEILESEYAVRLQILGIKKTAIEEDINKEITSNLESNLKDNFDKTVEALDKELKAKQEKKEQDLEALKEAEEQKREIIAQTSDFIADALGLDSNNIQKLFTGLTDGFESFSEKLYATLNVASDVLGTIGNISADLTQGRIDDIDREIEKDNEKFERQLENENLSEKDRKLIEDRKAKNEEKLNNKKVKEKEKQWKLDKAIALTQIAIQTALAVVKAGVITPTAILTGIVGALQFTLAATTKMPKFKKGTKNAPKGWAIVDEEGPEIHADKKGNIKSFGNDGGANYRFLEQGDIIMPHNDSESYKKLFRNSTLSGVKDDRKRVLRAQQITANDNKVNEALIASIVSREVAKATNSNLTKTIKDGFKGIKLKLDINDKTDSNIIYSRKDGF